MSEIDLSKLKKEYTSEEIAKKLAEEINIITLKRAVQIAEMLSEDRKDKMSKLVEGLESI